MSDFTDKLNKAKAALDQGEKPREPDELDQTLEEFAQWLETETPASASIEPGFRPEMRHLVTWPKHRPGERSFMLSFWRDGENEMRVMGQEQALQGPEQLAEYLIRFYSETAFPATLAEYKRRSSSPAPGMLKRDFTFPFADGDQVVFVEPGDMKTLYHTDSDGSVDLLATPDPPGRDYTQFKWDWYRWLEVGGMYVRLNEPVGVALEGDKLRIQGRKRPGPTTT